MIQNFNKLNTKYTSTKYHLMISSHHENNNQGLINNYCLIINSSTEQMQNLFASKEYKSA